MSKKILITGASGFIGACLSENLLREGYEVIAITRNKDKAWRLKKVINDINIYDIDLKNEFAVKNMIKNEKPEIIFNLATYGGYYFQKNNLEILENNIMGTANLLNACLDYQFESFINIGSSSEYGIKKEAMKENDVLEPINTYGVSKLAATLYCKMIALNENLPIATVRLFSPYGYYEDKSRLVSSVILSCLNNQNPKLASKNAVRDFIFIEDVIDILKVVSQSKDISGKIYNCGTGSQHLVSEIVEIIIKQSNKELNPNWGEIEPRKSDTLKWEADMSFVKSNLEWKPKYSIVEGIAKTYRWYEENIDLYMEKIK